MGLVLPLDFQEEDAPQILEQARALLDLPLEADLHVETVARTRRGTRIEFSCIRTVELDAGPVIHCVYVEVTGRGRLRFDARGSLVASHVEPPDENQLHTLRVQLERLVESGQIYVAAPGEQVEIGELRARGQSWYVESGPDGKQYLRRAWIA